VADVKVDLPETFFPVCRESQSQGFGRDGCKRRPVECFMQGAQVVHHQNGLARVDLSRSVVDPPRRNSLFSTIVSTGIQLKFQRFFPLQIESGADLIRIGAIFSSAWNRQGSSDRFHFLVETI